MTHEQVQVCFQPDITRQRKHTHFPNYHRPTDSLPQNKREFTKILESFSSVLTDKREWNEETNKKMVAGSPSVGPAGRSVGRRVTALKQTYSSLRDEIVFEKVCACESSLKHLEWRANK